MPVELPAGSWRNLTSIPLKELPAQSYFETLEEMVQDRAFYAESLAQVVSFDTENKHRLANPNTHSQHIAMLFDGSTIRPKRRLVSTMPEDLEGFRAKYEIIANVWRMMKLRSPGRTVLVGLTENTWKTHRRWLTDSKRFAMELEVAPRVLKAPGWHLSVSYEQKVREAAVDLIRMQMPAVSRSLGTSEERSRAQDDSLHFSTSFLVKFIQLSQKIRGSSLQQSALRRQSAHEQSRQTCIHSETARRRQSP